jgi:hypothetical protein
VTPETSGPWSKAIALHRRSAILDGVSIPESVTRLTTDIDTGSAGFVTPGQVLMYAREGELLRLHDVGAAIGEDGQTLDAIVVVFNREFAGQEQFVNEILGQLKTKGRTYREWMRHDTPVLVKAHPKAQDQMTAATMALVEFRRAGLEHADLRRVQFGTFEGSQGIVGAVLSHWS